MKRREVHLLFSSLRSRPSREARKLGTRSRLGLFSLLSLAAFTATGCSTHMVGLDYRIPEIGVTAADIEAKVGVRDFHDARATDPDWLGAIRGGFGNPLKRLRTHEPASSLVARAFREALEMRGLLASGEDADFLVTGEIQKLDCSEYLNREAHAHLLVRVIEPSSRDKLFERLYKVDEMEPGFGGGIFASVETLNDLAARTLSAAIDRALDDPDFLRVIIGGGPEPSTAAISEPLPVEETSL
jgi:hypothetical protein